MSDATDWPEFDAVEIETRDGAIFARRAGAGPAVLLLHGFPQTHLMWRAVAPLLSARFTVVCPDLPGYGHSFCPAARADHAPHAKRAMAQQMAAVMEQLGFHRFCIAGHDRGGRVAYRLALDHPDRVERLAVLDVLPVADVWERADKRLVTGYWPWSLLAQDEPLPERLLTAAPDAVVDAALGGWGTAASSFDAEVREAYIGKPARSGYARMRSVKSIALPPPSTMNTTRTIVAPDGASHVRFSCYGAGPDHWAPGMQDAGGPLALWRGWADDVRGSPIAGGHFFPEEVPQRTAEELIGFFARS